MKKAFFLLIFLVSVGWTYPAELRILGGVSLSKSTEPTQGPMFDFIYRPVFGVGAILGTGIELNLTQKVTVEVDALFFQKGSRIWVYYPDVLVDRFRAKMDELCFPVLFKLHAKPGTSPYILGGGEVGIVLNGAPRTIDYGLVFGAGFRKQVRGTYLGLEGRYYHGLQDMRTGTWILRRMRTFAFIVGLSI